MRVKMFKLKQAKDSLPLVVLPEAEVNVIRPIISDIDLKTEGWSIKKV